MLDDSIYPDLPSTEFDAIHDFAARVIRQARHESPLLTRDEVLAHPRVEAMMDYVEQRVLGAFDHPSTHFGEHLQDEYRHKATWSLDEAASLCVGMDPFYHTIDYHYYNPRWRNRRERVKAKLTKAMFAKQLPFAVQGTHLIVTPGDFCYWALVNDLVSDTAVDFFLETKRLRPERISDADPLRGSTMVNPQG